MVSSPPLAPAGVHANVEGVAESFVALVDGDDVGAEFQLQRRHGRRTTAAGGSSAAFHQESNDGSALDLAPAGPATKKCSRPAGRRRAGGGDTLDSVGGIERP
ncbi:MAG TPA: hypothetical protein VN240_05370 [Propylenella sp.]|nr:hypothetical protein [Propylenella sp.]